MEKLIVAVDGGPASRSALDWAIARARTEKSLIELTTVVGVDFTLPSDDGEAYERVLNEARDTAQSALPHSTVETCVRYGMAPDALIRASIRADLLVIGAKKPSALAGVTHAPLSQRVAGRAYCPTVVVPVGWTATTGPITAAWSDDEASELALDVAAREASRQHRGLRVVHGWEPPRPVPLEGPPSEALIDELSRAEADALSRAAGRIRLAFPHLDVAEVLRMESPATTIIGAAKDSSLVVMGSRGRGAITSLLLGSTSHAVLRALPSPVAVIAHHDDPVDVYPELLDEDLI